MAAQNGGIQGGRTHPTGFATPVSILQPLTYSASSCGYCSTVPGARSVAKSSKSYGAWAHALSCEMYKDLLDRGWRRSGAYMYKPDMARTCCPQYTISLDVHQFRPSRGQRQVLTRFAAFVRHGERRGQPGWGPSEASTMDVEAGGPMMAEPSASGSGSAHPELQSFEPEHELEEETRVARHDNGKGKAKAIEMDWRELVHAADWNDADGAAFARRFDCTLEPASYTEEKYDLYKKYQTQIHHEAEDTLSAKGFKRFLVDTPLELEPTCSSSYQYGSHHALYRLDGKLVAFAVLDILPRAVSSVYFVWDPNYAALSLGKVSALREAAMVRELEAQGAWEGGGGRYMMGYYIHTCPKMRYKADYQPSYLLDPPTNTFYPWSECKPRLDAAASGMTSFSAPFPIHDQQQLLQSSTMPIPADSDAAVGMDEDEDLTFEDDEDLELETDFPNPPPPGCLDPNALPIDVLSEAFVIQRRTLMPLLLADAWRDADMNREARELLATVGEAGKGRLAIFFGR